jgi:NADP-dependent 3-hydroxy acid dehydrogenase YdfG
MHAVLPGMRKRQDGLIVNICSTAGTRPGPLGGIAYGASKFAQRALGIGAGYEEGANGIRITNVYPGEVDTPILDNRPQKVSDEHKTRILQPEDIAAMVVAVAKLPARASVPEVIVKPTIQLYA